MQIALTPQPPAVGRQRAALPRHRPRFALAHLTLLHQSPPALVELAGRAGYEFVGLRIIPLNLPGEPVHPLVTDAALLRRTRAALESCGVRVLDVELARILPNQDVSRYLPALECAAQLGARHVLSSAWCADDHFVQDQFYRLCELARPLNLTVDFEFVTFAPYGRLDQAVALVRGSGCSNAGIMVDTLHFARSGHRPEELAGLPASWFHYAQICDGPLEYSSEESELKLVAREGRWYVGQGGVGCADIVSRLPDIPYSIELPNAHRRRVLGDELFARRCLVTARTCLEGKWLRW